MTKFIEKIPVTCDCGVVFTGQFSTAIDESGKVLNRVRINILNGPLCPKCNVKNGLKR